MNIIKKTLYLFLSVILASCAKITDKKVVASGNNPTINAVVSIPNIEKCTKTSISKDGTINWMVGDMIGLFSNYTKGPTNSPTQIELTLTTSSSSSAASFSTSAGWQLDTSGDYNYFAYYPYSSENTRNSIGIDYHNQTQLINGNSSGLGQYDYIYSEATLPDSPSSATFICRHIGAALNLTITVPTKFQSVSFKRMRIVAESQIFTTSGKYDIPSIAENDAPTFFDEEKSCYMDLFFGDYGITAIDGNIDTWMMIFPTELEGKELTVKLYADHTPVCTLEGHLNGLVNAEAGKLYNYELSTMTETGNYLPDKPLNGESLHVLLFGHSFGEDCTQYLPAISMAAGISSLHLVRLYGSGYTLGQHWMFCSSGASYGNYGYQESKPGTTEVTVYDGKRVLDILNEAPWDIILFQHGIGFEYAGDYSTYQPDLDSLINYTTRVCYQIHKKKPVVIWNMFWGYNSDKSTAADFDATVMYNAIVAATKEMKNDTGLDLIVAPGTAMENARKIYKVSDGYNLLTRDGYHASLGMGRYVSACTWFQYIMKPIYGIDVEGNTFRPSNSSFTKDFVNDDVALKLQKCAKAAVEHPYEVTPIAE